MVIKVNKAELDIITANVLRQLLGKYAPKRKATPTQIAGVAGSIPTKYMEDIFRKSKSLGVTIGDTLKLAPESDETITPPPIQISVPDNLDELKTTEFGPFTTSVAAGFPPLNPRTNPLSSNDITYQSPFFEVVYYDISVMAIHWLALTDEIRYIPQSVYMRVQLNGETLYPDAKNSPFRTLMFLGIPAFPDPNDTWLEPTNEWVNILPAPFVWKPGDRLRFQIAYEPTVAGIGMTFSWFMRGFWRKVK
jgi:hypothetical protein